MVTKVIAAIVVIVVGARLFVPRDSEIARRVEAAIGPTIGAKEEE